MKIKKGHHLSRIVVGFILLLSFPFSISQVRADPYPQIEPEGPPLISMDFQDADLKDVLKSFSQQSGLNFIASEKVKDRKVTLYLDKVTVQDALETIIDANDLIYTQAEDSKIFIVKEIDIPSVTLVTRIFTLKNAVAYKIIEPKEGKGAEGGEIEESDIVGVVDDILTDNGDVSIDVRTNSLIVTDRPYNMEAIEATIAKLDVKVPQVMIEVEVLETSLATLKALGFEWGGESGQLFSFSLANSAFMFPYQQVYENALGWRGGSGGVRAGTLGTGDVSAILELLIQDTETKILATPRILTLSNETAEININSNDAIERKVIWETTEFGERESIEITRPEKGERPGVSLKVTPIVNENNFITMVIEPKLITKTLSDVSTSDNIVYDLGFRTTKSTVTVSDGQTIIIGGLINTRDEEIMRKVPFLGDIPVLGTLFRKKDVERSDMELVFFITPHVVREGETSIETSSSTIEPTPVSPQPKGQKVAGLGKEAALKRAIGEAMAELSIEEASQAYEEALIRYKLISEWKSLE